MATLCTNYYTCISNECIFKHYNQNLILRTEIKKLKDNLFNSKKLYNDKRNNRFIFNSNECSNLYNFKSKLLKN